MKYNEKAFGKAVKEYKRLLEKKFSGKSIVAVVKLNDEKGFYSVAPLSQALHELNSDLNVFVKDKLKSPAFEVLKLVWKTFDELKAGKNSKRVTALKEFIETVNKKTKSNEFEKIFQKPDLILEGNGKKFYSKEITLPYNCKWFKRFKWKMLRKTTALILKEGYALKKHERMGIYFELVPAKKHLELPLEDYLDNFAIAYAMALEARKKCKRVLLGSASSRYSQLEPMERVSDLTATLVGCEYEKNINEVYFKKFKKLSRLFGTSKLKPNHAVFGIHGKGYSGKHFFGTTVGYPSPNKKTRWQSPGQMFLKPWWNIQTKIDKRKPQTRYGITETLPITNFIRTCYINYKTMRQRNHFVKSVVEKCNFLIVKGNVKVKGKLTDIEIDLREVLNVEGSDSDPDRMVDEEIFKKFKVVSGKYDNFPGGEAFFTPGKMNGFAIGDVVINIDRSYVIPKSNPLMVKFKNGYYKVVSGDKKIIKALNKRKKESWKLLQMYKKHKSLPKEVLKIYEKNFERVGEFAINTNPKARLSRYLIENEKIARMIHIALGSGYEPDRETLYHMDFVINSPKQKLDIYGIDSKGSQQWIIKKGKFVI